MPGSNELLRLALEELGPIYIKFGQLLSTRRDFLRSGAAVATLTLAPGVTLMAFGGSEAAMVFSRFVAR